MSLLPDLDALLSLEFKPDGVLDCVTELKRAVRVQREEIVRLTGVPRGPTLISSGKDNAT